MPIEDSHHFRRVDERLTTSGFLTRDQLASLGAEGYEVVVNLLPDEHERAVPDEGRLVAAQGLHYCSIPVDFAAPTGANLEEFAATMAAHAGRKIHVHCAANYRVSVFVALDAQRRGRWSGEEADAFIRDVWDLADAPVWEAFVADQRAALTPPGPHAA